MGLGAAVGHGRRHTHDRVDDLRFQAALANDLRGDRVAHHRRAGDFFPVGTVGGDLAGIVSRLRQHGRTRLRRIPQGREVRHHRAARRDAGYGTNGPDRCNRADGWSRSNDLRRDLHRRGNPDGRGRDVGHDGHSGRAACEAARHHMHLRRMAGGPGLDDAARLHGGGTFELTRRNDRAGGVVGNAHEADLRPGRDAARTGCVERSLRAVRVTIDPRTRHVRDAGHKIERAVLARDEARRVIIEGRRPLAKRRLWCRQRRGHHWGRSDRRENRRGRWNGCRDRSDRCGCRCNGTTACTAIGRAFRVASAREAAWRIVEGRRRRHGMDARDRHMRAAAEVDAAQVPHRLVDADQHVVMVVRARAHQNVGRADVVGAASRAGLRRCRREGHCPAEQGQVQTLAHRALPPRGTPPRETYGRALEVVGDASALPVAVACGLFTRWAVFLRRKIRVLEKLACLATRFRLLERPARGRAEQLSGGRARRSPRRFCLFGHKTEVGMLTRIAKPWLSTLCAADTRTGQKNP